MAAKHEEMFLHMAPPSVANYMVRHTGMISKSQKKDELIIADVNGGPHGGSIDIHVIQSILNNRKLADEKRPRGAAAQTAGEPPLKILKALTT